MSTRAGDDGKKQRKCRQEEVPSPLGVRRGGARRAAMAMSAATVARQGRGSDGTRARRRDVDGDGDSGGARLGVGQDGGGDDDAGRRCEAEEVAGLGDHVEHLESNEQCIFLFFPF